MIATLKRPQSDELLLLEPRDYQVNAIENVRHFFRNNPAPAMPVEVAGCGAGKTVIFAQMAWLAFEKGNRAMIICPYQSLLDQFLITLIYRGFKGTKAMYEIVLKNDPQLENPLTKRVKEIYDRNCKTKIWKNEIGWYAGSKPASDCEEAKVIIAMAQTLESRGFPDVPIALVGYDEWHLTYFRRELQAQISNWKYYKQCREVGFTATPYHNDGRKPPQGTQFHTVITTKQLIESGHNSPYVYMPLGVLESKYAMRSNDLTKAEESALLKDSFAPEKSFEYLHNPSKYSDTNRELKSVFEERTIFFFSRKAIAQEYIDYYQRELVKLNINKELLMVCDETPTKQRKEAYLKFRNKEALLFTVTALAVGFDEPSVENIVLHRPFTEGSFALFIQIIGRGLRPSPNTNKTICRIYDMCANPYFPLPDEIEDWNIPDDKQLRKICNLPIPLKGKTCDNCGVVNGKNMKNCYKCGEILPAAKEKTDGEKFEELAKLVAEYNQENEGIFKINNISLSRVRDLLIRINEQFNQFNFKNQETKVKIFECLVSLQRAVKGFIFKNNPLPVEKLDNQTILLVQLSQLNLMPDDPILALITKFKNSVDDFLIKGQTNNSLADRFLSESKELLGSTDVLKFIERACISGQTPETAYRMLLKLSVLLYKYDPNWAYYELKRLYPQQANIPINWRKHAIFGDNPTYGNYCLYHDLLWSKYKKHGDKAHNKVYGALASEFGKYYQQFYNQFELDKKSGLSKV